jgi:hypothetical protein
MISANSQEDVVKAQIKIREWCNKDGRKLSWIAHQVPVAASSLSRWMTGRITPSAVYRHRIADITGMEELRAEELWVKP